MANGELDVGNEVMIDLQLEAVKPASKLLVNKPTRSYSNRNSRI
jgi:hypothetical protein